MMSLRLHPPLKTYNILIGNFKIDEILIINLTKIHYGIHKTELVANSYSCRVIFIANILLLDVFGIGSMRLYIL